MRKSGEGGDRLGPTGSSGSCGAMRSARRATRRMARVAVERALAPAALTAMTEPLLEDPDAARKRLERFALGRYGAPEEISPAFVFLASEESDYITGQVLCVDGGLVI